ncbi:MAG: hypothetical protein ACRDM7_17970 [Thermoleophilaceae bacterium]
MSQVANVPLRPASPRRLLGPLVALFVATVVVVVLLLASASSEPLPNGSVHSGAHEESTQAVEAHVVPRGAGPFWLSRGGADR